MCGTQQLVPPDATWLHSDDLTICFDAVVHFVINHSTPYVL